MNDRDAFLQTIQIPNEFCAFDSTPNCAGLTKYRTPTGVCNNLQRPYEGSSQTAFGRILTAAYQDGKHEEKIHYLRERFH